jgi:hypothetical protein
VPEIKRLFTYRDDFELVGTRASIQAQLGNSVPPLLAEKVIRSFSTSDDDLSEDVSRVYAAMSQCDHVDVWCYGLSGGLVVLA